MWSIPSISPNRGSIATNHRQFSTFNNFKNMITTKQEQPFCGTNLLNINNWNTAPIVSNKSFKNPNFVNKNNPKIHNYQKDTMKYDKCQLDSSSKCQMECDLLKKCSKFIKDNSRKVMAKTDVVPIEEVGMCKTNRYVKKQNKKKQKRNQYKKNAKRKLTKNAREEAVIEMNYIDIDEVGVDITNTKTNLKDDFKQPPISTIKNLSSSPICISIGTPTCKAKVFFSISPPRSLQRSKLPSECDSEDSFIVFDSQEADDEELQDETDTDETDEEEDVVDFVSSFKTIKFNAFSKDIANCKKKVRFAEDRNLCKIYPMVKWSYAYRTSRKGPWEEYARDTERFKMRINNMERLLSPILQKEHRWKIFNERFK